MPNLPTPQAPATVTEPMRTTLLGYVTTLAPYKITLVDTKKPGLRTMAEGREGYARLVSQIANNHPEAIARELDPVSLVGLLDYDNRLSNVYFAIKKVLEVIDETRSNNGINAMLLVDTFVSYLQASRHNNGSLDLAMREVDEWNKRFANKKEQEQEQEQEPEQS